MYPVTELFKSKIRENNRVFRSIIEIQHSTGSLYLYDRDLVSGTLLYNESSQSGEDFTIGGTVASDIEFGILNKPEYANINFMGATVIATIGLEIVPGMGLTYEQLKAYTYDQLRAYTYGQISGVYEYVNLGRFNIDEVGKQRNTIKLKAIDNMIEFDKPYSLSQLSYPATLYQIYVNACNVCDVQIGTVSFPNMNHVVQERPQEDLTFRDVIGYVAELSGTFAKCNRVGALELKWYTASGITLTPSNRFNFIPRDDLVQIKGIMATVDDTTYLTGSEDYAIDLSENPLLQGGYETVLPNIYNNVKDTIFTPYGSSWQGNPAMQAGDMITQIDRDGKSYTTLVTNSTYKYRGVGSLSAKGLPLVSKGYKGSTNKKIANIIRKVEKQVGDKLTTLEQAQLNATQLIANMLGGYAIVEGDSFYVADNQNLSLAQKVWKWGIGGFGYSSSGVNGPYTTAITADGSIVAMLVAANIITANMVQTGILTSEDGSTHIDLDNGSFNFKNALQWVNNQLLIQQGIITIDKDKVRVNHSVDGTEYSEMRANGVVRGYSNGEASYLNGIHVIYVENFVRGSETRTPYVYVELPTHFSGRGSEIEVLTIPGAMRWEVGDLRARDDIRWLTETGESYIRYDLSLSNLNATIPYIAVRSEVKEVWNHYTSGEEEWYHGMDFVVLIIGK